ncbi:MAG: hypothetical protein ACRDUV_23295 [Pseudonocardiaceae bacterium]
MWWGTIVAMGVDDRSVAEVGRGMRPPRRYNQLTDEGRLSLGVVLQEARSDARFAGMVRRSA